MTTERARENGREDAGYLNQFGGMNAGYVADLIERYLQDPASVPSQDRELLQSVDAALGRAAYAPVPVVPDAPVAAGGVDVRRLSRLLSYIEAIRNYGYRVANLDPLGLRSRREPLLDPATHGITGADQATSAAQAIAVAGGAGALKFGATAGDLTASLREVYCGTIGYEIAHIRSSEERAWLRNTVESGRYRPFITPEQKAKILELLTGAEVFEQFLHRAFPGQRWYSLEGCESLVVLTDQIILQAAFSGVRNVVVGMAHRGRLNLLTHIFGKPYQRVLAEFVHGINVQEGDLNDDRGWMTDVKYHMGARTTRDVDGDGAADIGLLLMPNPSHLEMVNPAVAGAVRALQEAPASGGQARPAGRSRPHDTAMGLMIHGDAAFAGQGIVAETLNLAGLPGYRTGGAIHIILNNQLGFTTDPADSFSTEHASDVALGFGIPVVHVNADDIEACVSVAKLAVAYRQKFGKDFLIDLVAYRRVGHNENDDPTFTQPVMYRAIEGHPTSRALWAERLVGQGTVTADEPEQLVREMFERLQAFKDASADAPPDLQGVAMGATGETPVSAPVTARPQPELRDINSRLTTLPPGFTPHPRVSRLLERRREVFEQDGRLDWGHAEALALGTILQAGTPIRFAGQDSERGTFSHRHAVVRDFETGEPYTPLGALGGAQFAIYNSPLSEQAALAFEHGYSVLADGALVIWEAQFGDFVNNAQSVVDELIASGRAKWGQRSGLVLLLPHGYEGQGANHSYAHLHRFLALTAGGNMRVVYPTTAAQYFHLLRLQAGELWADPKPMIVMAPKSLLRHPMASSGVQELTGGRFKPVIADARDGEGSRVRRLIVCTGKVYADLAASDEFATAADTSAIRIEQLYPFPHEEFAAAAAQFPAAGQAVWLQEEPQNRGAWAYMAPHLRDALGGRHLTYCGRTAMPSPAEGAHWVHKISQDRLVQRALGLQERGAVP